MEAARKRVRGRELSIAGKGRSGNYAYLQKTRPMGLASRIDRHHRGYSAGECDGCGIIGWALGR